MFFRIYLLLILPIKAILMQTTTFEGATFAAMNISQITNSLFILINVLLILLNHSRIMSNRRIRPVYFCILLLVFVSSLQPIFSFIFTRSLGDIASLFKILSWITLIPLAAIGFTDVGEIYKFRKSGIAAFFVLCAGLVIANLLHIGNLAYRTGPLYLGFFKEEAPVAIALMMCLPLFFLPIRKNDDGRFLNFSTICYVIIDFILILLVMKRSAVIFFCVGLLVILILLRRHRLLKLSPLYIAFIMFILVLIIPLASWYFVGTDNRVFQSRFTDFSKYETSQNISALGAGRFGLYAFYLNAFLDSSPTNQLIGFEPAGVVTNTGMGYLQTYGNVPHNDYLDFLMRNGVLGLTCHLIFLISVIFLCRQVYVSSVTSAGATLSACAVGATILYLLSSLVDNSFSRVFPMSIFGILLGVAAGISDTNTEARNYTAQGNHNY